MLFFSQGRAVPQAPATKIANPVVTLERVLDFTEVRTMVLPRCSGQDAAVAELFDHAKASVSPHPLRRFSVN